MNNLLRLLVLGGLCLFAVLIVALGMARNIQALLGPAHLILFVLAVALYLLPMLLAMYRDCEAAAWIAAVDVLLGWTVFGWFLTLGWAAGGKVRALPARAVPPPAHPVPGH
jgi:Superinfection immunity protein